MEKFKGRWVRPNIRVLSLTGVKSTREVRFCRRQRSTDRLPLRVKPGAGKRDSIMFAVGVSQKQTHVCSRAQPPSGEAGSREARLLKFESGKLQFRPAQPRFGHHGFCYSVTFSTLQASSESWSTLASSPFIVSRSKVMAVHNLSRGAFGSCANLKVMVSGFTM